MDGYYQQQAQMPYFSGHQRQRGSGFGALALGVSRVALPFLRKYAVPVAKRIGRELLQQGLPELMDVITKRKTPKQAMTNTVKKTIRKQVGAGTKRKAKSAKPRKRKTVSRKRKASIIPKVKPAKRSRSEFFSKIKYDQ